MITYLIILTIGFFYLLIMSLTNTRAICDIKDNLRWMKSEIELIKSIMEQKKCP